MKDKNKKPKVKFLGAFTVVLCLIEIADIKDKKFSEKDSFDIKQFKEKVGRFIDKMKVQFE